MYLMYSTVHILIYDDLNVMIQIQLCPNENMDLNIVHQIPGWATFSPGLYGPSDNLIIYTKGKNARGRN